MNEQWRQTASRCLGCWVRGIIRHSRVVQTLENHAGASSAWVRNNEMEHCLRTFQTNGRCCFNSPGRAESRPVEGHPVPVGIAPRFLRGCPHHSMARHRLWTESGPQVDGWRPWGLVDHSDPGFSPLESTPGPVWGQAHTLPSLSACGAAQLSPMVRRGSQICDSGPLSASCRLRVERPREFALR